MKRLFFVLLILALISMIFTTTSCKKTYDIRGTWTVTVKFDSNGASFTYTINFKGDISSGTFEFDWYGIIYTGSWTVEGDEVLWTLDSYNSTYSGTIEDDNHMSGTMYFSYNGQVSDTGKWTASR